MYPESSKDSNTRLYSLRTVYSTAVIAACLPAAGGGTQQRMMFMLIDCFVLLSTLEYWLMKAIEVSLSLIHI